MIPVVDGPTRHEFEPTLGPTCHLLSTSWGKYDRIEEVRRHDQNQLFLTGVCLANNSNNLYEICFLWSDADDST